LAEQPAANRRPGEINAAVAVEDPMDNLEELRKAIRRKDEAYGAGDIAGYLKAYAPDVRMYFAGSLMTFEEARRLIEGQFADGGRILEYEIADPDHISFSAAGDAATVCYPWRERFRYGDGRVTDTDYYETNAWYRRNGEWKIVLIHISTVLERATGA
jgi:ketosteroid isomerase-like protein